MRRTKSRKKDRKSHRRARQTTRISLVSIQLADRPTKKRAGEILCEKVSTPARVMESKNLSLFFTEQPELSADHRVITQTEPLVSRPYLPDNRQPGLAAMALIPATPVFSPGSSVTSTRLKPHRLTRYTNEAAAADELRCDAHCGEQQGFLHRRPARNRNAVTDRPGSIHSDIAGTSR